MKHPIALRRWFWAGSRVFRALVPLLLAPAACAGEADFAAQRESLVREVERQVMETRHELGTDRLDPAVLAALRTVPRHAFVPPALHAEAYGNHPLPIGAGQTISQPYVVAIMTQLLDVGPGDRVYELGTGSGYQAAVLAAMGVEVYSVEIVPKLADRARETLEGLGYDKARVRAGDGYLGWPEAAPFDGIVVTAAADHIPQPLIDQLATGGRLVMPLGAPGWVQQLVLMEKTAEGKLERRDLLPVRFVPVTGPNVR
ncbi:MAG: protein-L-isoaspartate(D-aspartate) O-methyltransferase [Pseudomonadota bacterium]|nr:protein-L-isoaspartate(D-aspartate) O-methyltransferase [Pseudomonadota bacterium]